jgi:hypothetical protein
MKRRGRRNAFGIDLLASLYDQLTPQQQAYLEREGSLSGDAEAILAYLAETPYPVSAETAAAVQASASRFILPWGSIGGILHAWVQQHNLDLGLPPVPQVVPDPALANLDLLRDSFDDPESFGEYMEGLDFSNGVAGVRDVDFEAMLVRVEVAMAGLVGEEEIGRGRCLRLECIPLESWALKVVPLFEGVWIDRLILELAEWCALLTAKGFQRLPALDSHCLAWERFYPAGTDWSTPAEAPGGDLQDVRAQAKRHLARYPGRTREVNGRPYLHVEDYAAWPGRKIPGDLLSPPYTDRGIFVPAWNRWLEAHISSDRRYLGGGPAQWISQPAELPQLGAWEVVTERDLHHKLAARAAAVAAVTRLETRVSQATGQEEPLVPSDLHQRIMKALYRRQLTTQKLQDEMGVDRKQLFGQWGLRPLLKKKLVRNNGDRKGYYRPDAPPQLLADPEE